MRPALQQVDAAATGAVHIVPVDVFGTGNRTYLAASGGQVMVIDPPRDYGLLSELVSDHGWAITHVLETHVHSDYVSGGLRLARDSDADYIVPAGAKVLCAARMITDDETFDMGKATVRALLTPGHTPHHLTYVISADGVDVAAFTGGGLLYGGVGRTDLLGPDLALELARAQWDSARRLAGTVDSAARVLPTHGFGSFCAIGAAIPDDWSLAGVEDSNDVFALAREAFAAELVERHGPYPTYFHRIPPINVRGTPSLQPETPQACTSRDLVALAAGGAWVIDIRPRFAFDDGHLTGSISFDLDGPMATYVGWVVPWGSALHLIADDVEQLDAGRTELARIGYDQVDSYFLYGDVDSADETTIPLESGAALLQARRAQQSLRVLDVRLPAEWEAGHVEGALHVPVHEIPSRLDEIAAWAAQVRSGEDQRVWAYCGVGYRSAIAASLLDRSGIPAVQVDGAVVELMRISNPGTAGEPPPGRLVASAR